MQTNLTKASKATTPIQMYSKVSPQAVPQRPAGHFGLTKLLFGVAALIPSGSFIGTLAAPGAKAMTQPISDPHGNSFGYPEDQIVLGYHPPQIASDLCATFAKTVSDEFNKAFGEDKSIVRKVLDADESVNSYSSVSEISGELLRKNVIDGLLFRQGIQKLVVSGVIVKATRDFAQQYPDKISLELLKFFNPNKNQDSDDIAKNFMDRIKRAMSDFENSEGTLEERNIIFAKSFLGMNPESAPVNDYAHKEWKEFLKQADIDESSDTIVGDINLKNKV